MFRVGFSVESVLIRFLVIFLAFEWRIPRSSDSLTSVRLLCDDGVFESESTDGWGADLGDNKADEDGEEFLAAAGAATDWLDSLVAPKENADFPRRLAYSGHRVEFRRKATRGIQGGMSFQLLSSFMESSSIVFFTKLHIDGMSQTPKTTGLFAEDFGNGLSHQGFFLDGTQPASPLLEFNVFGFP
jgi:hypothetical protein